MAEPFTIYKLTILYMLDKAGFPLSNTQISNFFLEKEYTDYFRVQEVIGDLVNADLIIYVVDSSTPLDENDEKIMEMIKDRTALVLLNKSDLDTVTTEEMIASHLDQKIIKVSMKENQGVDELENAIKELFFHGKVELNDEVYITNARHKAALSNAKDSLNMVLDSIAMEMPEDFYSIDLMNTYEELGNILGESLGEDLVNEIFSKFCTGK